MDRLYEFIGGPWRTTSGWVIVGSRDACPGLQEAEASGTWPGGPRLFVCFCFLCLFLRRDPRHRPLAPIFDQRGQAPWILSQGRLTEYYAVGIISRKSVTVVSRIPPRVTRLRLLCQRHQYLQAKAPGHGLKHDPPMDVDIHAPSNSNVS